MPKMVDWFERLTGFPEASYAETKANLSVKEGFLHSDASDRRAAVGQLELVSLAELRTLHDTGDFGVAETGGKDSSSRLDLAKGTVS